MATKTTKTTRNCEVRYIFYKKQLQDIEKFKNFKVDFTLKWNDELDLAPEFLYFKSFQNEQSLQHQFKEWGYI